MQSAIFTLLFLFSVNPTDTRTRIPKISPQDYLSAKILINTTDSIIKDGIRRVSLLTYIKKHIHNCAAFEVGYLTYVIQERYRQMVDKYNVSSYMMTRLYLMELIMYLEEVEHYYWDIDHLYSMMHEIERKYRIKDGSQTVLDYVETTTKVIESWEEGKFTTMPMPTRYQKPKRLKKGQKEIIASKLLVLQGVTKKSTRWWWPLEYGLTVCLNLPKSQNLIINDLSWGTKLKVLKQYKNTNRRVGVAYLHQSVVTKAEDSMKMKLFRLMYETIRDSDLKVRRAELIRQHYTNSTPFDIGFIIGDMTDKFNIMTDISLTVKRLYSEWKPMEHISAYEQIANKAIEITNLIDMIRLIERKHAKGGVARI